jgi:Xaa-Pro aminopeptidase
MSSTITLSERLNTPISTGELERRWAATRRAMEDAGIDVLLVQSRTQEVGGYVRWLADLPALFVPVTIVFPRDDLMTVITHGDVGQDLAVPAEGTNLLRGVKRYLTTPSFPSIVYTAEYDAELALRALAPYAQATIGIVGRAQISLAAGERIMRELPQASFVEASNVLDPLRAVKSPEEQDRIRATAALQDLVMERAIDAVEPGRRESDIMAVARRAAHELGAEAGVYLSGAGPVGEPTAIAPGHLQHRVLQVGDVLSLLVEVDGPGGFYAELGRMCMLGRVSPELEEEHAFMLEAQRFTVDLLRPGASCRDIWEAYNTFLSDHGRAPERRLHAHNQGYDLVERPLIRFDETMEIAAGMNMACHPSYPHLGVWWWICDNWLIGPDGAGDRLHAYPQRIVER